MSGSSVRRTEARAGSWRAAASSLSRAASKLACGMPLAFCSSRVKPADWPRPRMAGGIRAKTRASRKFWKAAEARATMASAVFALPVRWDQSTKLRKPWPVFWPAVPPPPPATVKMALTLRPSWSWK